MMTEEQLRRQVVVLAHALRNVSQRQEATLEKLRTLGVVFTDIGADPKNWQHVAFTIYSEFVEAASIARQALEEDGP